MRMTRLIASLKLSWQLAIDSLKVALCAILFWMAAPAQAANIVREPMHGYWVGYVGPGYANTLFQNWRDAAAAQCNGEDLIHPQTTPPATLNGTYNLYCWYPGKVYFHWVGGAYWSDACPETTSPPIHDPARRCYVAGEKPPCQCDRHGNPVSFSSKAKLQVEQDYLPAHALGFARHYNSNVVAERPDAMGLYWRHSYSRRLMSTFALPVGPNGTPVPPNYRLAGGGWFPLLLAPSAGQHNVDIHGPDGFGYHFVSADGGQTWAADADVKARLVVTQFDGNGKPAQWELRDESDNVQVYDAAGQFIEMRTAHGGSYQLAYSDASTPSAIAAKPGLLIGIVDNYGRTLSFEYNASHQMVKILDAAGSQYLYQYDGEGKLTQVTYPDGLSRLYHYDEPAYNPQQHVATYRGLLTGISDEIASGVVQRLGIYKYSDRKPVSTEHAGGVNKYTFEYTSNEVVDPLGTRRQHYYNIDLGAKVLSSSSQPRVGSSSKDYLELYYDASGNVNRKFDFNGAVSCFMYDSSRNLETVRVEGTNLSTCTSYLTAATVPAGARKITTVWHSAFRQPVTIFQPSLREDWTYDAAGRVLSHTSRATTDPSGALGSAAGLTGTPRVFTYTYDANGKLLTRQEPRTDVAAVTTYAYDSSGNLTQVTNAAGQVTQLSAYDAHGRPGHIVDPNGLTTNLSYTWRGLPSSITVGGEMTSYTYDGAGKLTQVSYPSGATLSFSYDGAGRQVGVSDAAGNAISYTLDPAGNRLSEQVRDGGGVLTRQISRLYDVLNRLKQITGALQ